jgi:hypothetical protein
LEQLSTEEPREWGSNGVQRRLDNWNLKFRSCKIAEPREWEYNGVQHRELELSQLSVGKSHGKVVVEEELEFSLCRLIL